MSILKIHLLGHFSITYHETELRGLQQPRLQALLAYLLLRRGELVSRQQLAFLFWPDSTERQAKTNLRNLLHRLKRALPESDRCLLVTQTSVQWLEDAPCWLDVAEFEAALAQAETYPNVREEAIRRAEALYQGELLPNMYDDWVLTTREALHQKFMRVLILLLDDLEANGRLSTAIAVAQRLLDLDPLREKTYRVLMQLYGENGDKTGVVQTYQACETMLEQELGVEPSRNTVRTYRRFLDGDSPQPIVPSASGVTPLIGRNEEWRRLYKAWQWSKKRRPHLVLLSGPAGVGKSRLARELIEKLQRQGISVANARAYKSEDASFYATLVDLLRSDALRAAVRSLDAVWRNEIAVLMGEWSDGERKSEDAEVDAVAMSLQRQRLFEALARACANQPLLLHIDDVHWCDAETLAWLQYLLRYHAAAPLLILLTARPEDMAQHKALLALLWSVQNKDLLKEIVLGPLNKENTGTLAMHLLGRSLDEDERDLLYAETEGNPLFIVEMVAMGTQSGDWDLQGKEPKLSPTASLTPKLQTVIETRLVQLSPEAQELARLGSVFGREFSLTMLAQVCSHDEESMVQAMDELCQRHIVQEVGSDAYYFTHGKLRAVAYAGLSRARRRVSHRRIAIALEANHGQSPYFASQIARHFRAAGEEEKSVPYELIAGDAARMNQAYEEATEHYLRVRAVLEESDDYERQMQTLNKLGLLYHLTGDYVDSDEAYAQAFALDKQLRHGVKKGDDRTSRTLRIAMLTPTYADPGKDNGAGAWLIDQLFSGLMTLNADMDVTPDVAQSWQVSADGCTYTFCLRKDVRWSDGEPVKANDFLYAWKRILVPDSISPYASLLYDIQGARALHQGGALDEDAFGVRALDAHTLEVSLVQPNSDFLYVMAHRLAFPVPAHVVERLGDDWVSLTRMVGNGPFLMDDWKPGERLLLGRNPTYHGERQGNATRVSVLLLGNWSDQAPLFEKNEVDVVTAHNLPARETLHLMRNQTIHEILTPDLHISYVAFNTRKPPFDDHRVRLAFVLATDRRRLANSLLDQYNLPVTGGFLPPGLAGHTPDLALPYDPERARALLAEAGYSDGVGLPELQCIEGKKAGIWRAASELLREQWQHNLGVQVSTQRVSMIEVLDHLYGERPPHLCLLGWRADYPTSDNFLRITPIKRQTGWQRADYDRWVQEARTSNDQGQRLQQYRQADRLLVEEAPILPLAYHRWQLLHKSWVETYPVSPMSFWNWKDVVLAG